MSQRSKFSKARARSIIYSLVVIFLFLISDLIWLQLIRGETLARRARDQRIEALYKTPLRGTIYDRNMQVLAGTFYEPAIVIFPQLVSEKDKVAEFLSRTSNTSMPLEAYLSQLLAQTCIYLDASKITLDNSHSEIPDDPGVTVIRQPVRYEPRGLAAHLIGYLDNGKISGISGIEKSLDTYLSSGRTGLIASFVDARRLPYKGLGIRWLADTESIADVVLTIDRKAQQIVEEVMDARVLRGAVVVMDPKTGQVLAMASRPTFSPNDVGSALIQPQSPMINRAILPYPAGSILKIVVAACGLEKNVVSLSEHFHDPGFIDVGSKRFKCYLFDNEGHGAISFLDAMAYSCNSVFIEVALRIGARSLVSLYEDLGFGATTGISLPFEQPGLLPNPYHMSLQDTANLAIGQGEALVTPLQLAVLLSVIANGGEFISPRLVLEIIPRERGVRANLKSGTSRRVLSQDTCRQLTFMLESVTRWGTGQAGWVDELGSCGKTGTAETGRLDSFGYPICHAWFAGFTPLKDPRFVIVVFAEEGGSGGEVAAPVFKEIADRLLVESLHD
ncbi:MAG: penicillin-binding protein 2 [Firmicutes bacterium]|nr:penicillin-binding protein 2 [Bacillota bacterium]